VPYFKSPAQAADELGLKEATVRRLARQCKTFTKVGRRVMFAPEDVEALIDKIKNPPPPPDWWSTDEPDPFS
jgi:hypothetical protein